MSGRQFYHNGLSFDEHKRNIVLEAMHVHNGNRTQAARALNVSIRALRNWISLYDLGSLYPYAIAVQCPQCSRFMHPRSLICERCRDNPRIGDE